MVLSSNLLILHPEMLFCFGQWAEIESWIFLFLFCRPVCGFIKNLEQVDSIYEMCHSGFYVQKEDVIFDFIYFAANMS